MSADDFYTIRRHPAGGFAAVLSFASVDTDQPARATDRQFATAEEAFEWACEQYAEHGVQFHPECNFGALVAARDRVVEAARAVVDHLATWQPLYSYDEAKVWTVRRTQLLDDQTAAVRAVEELEGT